MRLLKKSNNSSQFLLQTIILLSASLINIKCNDVEVGDKVSLALENSGSKKVDAVHNDVVADSRDESDENGITSLRTRSILASIESIAAAQNRVQQSPPNVEQRILDALTQSLDAIKNEKCLSDVNRTLEGVRSRQWWAIASK